ncbi:MAG: hypothetical protein GX776_05020 [Oxalobacter sp.]|nr:hypothetical protein [Oxalobacter sp.]
MQTISQGCLAHLAHEGKIYSARVIDDEDGFHLMVRIGTEERILLSEHEAIRHFPTLKDATGYLHHLGIPYAIAPRKRRASPPGNADLTHDAYVQSFISAARHDSRAPVANSDVMEAARQIINSRKRVQHA